MPPTAAIGWTWRRIRDEQGIIGIAKVISDYGLFNIGFAILLDAIAVFILKIVYLVTIRINKGGARYVVNTESDPAQTEAANPFDLIDIVDEL